MRTRSLVLGLSLALGCGRGRRAAPACDHGAPGFTAYPAACTHADCRACVTELRALWARRAEAPARAAHEPSAVDADRPGAHGWRRRRRDPRAAPSRVAHLTRAHAGADHKASARRHPSRSPA